MPRYAGTLSHFTGPHPLPFIQYKNGTEDLDIKRLDFHFISEYVFWLKSVRACCHNTTMRYLSNFKKIVLYCVRNGWLYRDPFYKFKLNKNEVIKTALTERELQFTYIRSMVTERLAQVKDIFLFSRYTGLYRGKKSESRKYQRRVVSQFEKKILNAIQARRAGSLVEGLSIHNVCKRRMCGSFLYRTYGACLYWIPFTATILSA